MGGRQGIARLPYPYRAWFHIPITKMSVVAVHDKCHAKEMTKVIGKR